MPIARPPLRHRGLRLSVMLRVVIGLAACVVVGVAVLSLALRSPALERRVLRLAETQASSSINGRIRIGGLHLRPLSQACLTDVSLISHRGDTLISARRLDVSIRLLPLLWRRAVLRHVRATDVKGVYDLGAHPNMVDLFAPPPPQPPSAWRVAIQRIVLDSVDFAFADSSSGIRTSLHNARLNGGLSLTGTLTASLSCGEGALSYAGDSHRLDSLFVRSRIGTRECDLKQIHVAFARELKADGSLCIPYANDGAWHATVLGVVDTALAARTIPDTWGIRADSPLLASGRLDGRLARPAATVRISTGTLICRGLALRDATLLLGADSSTGVTASVQVDEGLIRGRIKATAPSAGLFSLNAATPYVLDGRINLPDLPATIAVLASGASLPQGSRASASINVTAAGSRLDSLPDSARVSGAVSSIRLANGEDTPPVALRGSLRRGIVSASLDWAGALHAECAGSVAGQGASVNGSFRIADVASIAQLAAHESVHGSVSGTMHYNNARGAPYVDVQMQGSGLAWQELEADTVSLDIQHQDGITEISAARTVVSGPIDSACARLGMPGLAGALRATVTAQGSLGAPYVRADALLTGVHYGATRVADTLVATVHITREAVDAQDVRCVADSTVVTGSCTYYVSDRRVAALLSVNDLRTSEWTAGPGMLDAEAVLAGAEIASGTLRMEGVPLSAAQPWIRGVRVPHGAMRGSGRMQGSVRNPTATAWLRVGSIGVGGHLLAPYLGAQGSLTNGAASFACSLQTVGTYSLMIARGAASLDPAHGWAIDTTKESPVSIRVVGQNIDVAPYAVMLAESVQVSGRAAVDMDLTLRRGKWEPRGSLRLTDAGLADNLSGLSVKGIELEVLPESTDMSSSIDSLRASVSARTGPFSWKGMTLQKTWLRGTIGASQLHIADGGLTMGAGSASVKGTIPLMAPLRAVADPGLDLTVTASRIVPTVLNPILEWGAFVDGALDGSLRIRPGRGRVSIDGLLRARNLVFTAEDITPRLGPIEFDAAIHNDTLSLSSLSGSWGKGSIRGKGHAILGTGGVTSARLQIDGKRIPINYAGDMYQILLDSTALILTNNAGNWRLDGSTVLGHSRVQYDMMPLRAQLNGVTRTADNPSTVGLGFLLVIPDCLEADVTVGQFLTGAVSRIQTTLGGSVRIGGTLGKPTYSGSIHAVGGSATYLDRTFDITQGNAHQPGGSELNPMVSISAGTTIKEAQGGPLGQPLKVTLSITGDAGDPVHTLTSEPTVYSEADLVSLLTFGSTSLQSMKTDSSGTLLRDRASALLAQSISAYATQQARKLLGVDQLQIQGNILNPQATEKPLLTVSKSLGTQRNLTLTYQGRVGNAHDQKAIVSWRLLPFLFLDGETDVQGVAGVDMKVKVQR